MKLSTGSRTSLLAGLIGVALLGSGTAYAFWATTGHGDGAAAAGTMQPPTVTVGTVASGQLYPGAAGATAGDLVVVASNPNPFPVTVTVTASGAATTGCTTPAVSFSGGSFGLAANEKDASRTLARTVGMGTTSSSDCQGATIVIPLSTTTTSR